MIRNGLCVGCARDFYIVATHPILPAALGPGLFLRAAILRLQELQFKGERNGSSGAIQLVALRYQQISAIHWPHISFHGSSAILSIALLEWRQVPGAPHLLQMAKAWKRECSVEMKSICLEVLVGVFVKQWIYRDKSLFWYDWMIRDFFEFLSRYVNGWARPAGSDEQIELGDCWASKCQSAYNRALKACHFEVLDNEQAAAQEWQKIFGFQFRSSSGLLWSNLLALARS